MRIALVGAHVVKRPGVAAERSRLAHLAEALSQRGLDVTLYTSQPPGSKNTALPYRMMRLPTATGGAFEAEMPTDAQVAAAVSESGRFLVGRWTREPPDMVHADDWSHGLAAQLAAGRLGIPTVQVLSELSSVLRRRQDRNVGSPARARFERLLARGATRAVVACTEDVVDLAKLGCPRGNVTVLPQGIDLDAFTTTGPVAARTAEHRIVALVDDLLPHSGLDDAIYALARTRLAELVIVGGPAAADIGTDHDVARLRAVALKLGVAERVHFTGAVPSNRIPEILRSADVLVSPSWYEPDGTSVIKAMACGVPVIASEAGGMLDSVVHEVTGVLVPPRSPRQLGDALNGMVHAGALRKGMGLAGRARATSCYGWERVAAEAQTLYEGVSAVSPFHDSSVG